MDYGTCGLTEGLVAGGATPVKNWLLAGKQAFPTLDKIADFDTVIQYQVKKYGCSNCPIACGGIFKVSKGPYPLAEVHKPEYETIAAFGTMCMNDNLLSIIKLNDMCNRSGLDTISAGSVLAFAMECFEKGIITKSDTEGIELTWGNAEAMVAMLKKIIRREGLGDVETPRSAPSTSVDRNLDCIMPHFCQAGARGLSAIPPLDATQLLLLWLV
ncbi:MAG: hypothetical protein AMJ37_04800 [Dehalococcoidia bacterium DG_18]|nr:MAG: hypothetical protein AMJ37_04800 [Dehalococcoidia bacterium DG_18]